MSLRNVGKRGPYETHPTGAPVNSVRKDSWTGRETVCKRLAIALRAAMQRSWREERFDGMTQEALADALGVSRSSVAAWTTARKPIPARHLDKLRELLPAAKAWEVEEYQGGYGWSAPPLLRMKREPKA